MKSIKIALLVFIICTPCANAQWLKKIFAYDNLYEMPKNEVSVSMGLAEAHKPIFVSDHDYHVTPAQQSSLIHYDTNDTADGYWIANFELRYMQNLNKRLALGLSLGVVGKESNLLSASPESGPYFASVNRSHYYLMPTVRAYWYNRKHFGIYSSASIGLSISSTTVKDYDPHDGMVFSGDRNSVKFAGEIVPLGFEVGGSHLRFFMETSGNLVSTNIMLLGIKGMF